ncbi:helix-turn-helix domain-containing protein [Corynebacterium glutamicum]|uniref:helix-turn-helix domain-containing protein n=1 Tax=Corynebacterium glutamicum TaxID=1718 RepID=UPI003B63DCBF
MSDRKWLEANPKETWLVANDNGPGKQWFGRKVQIARQDQGISVAELASQVGLAEGTIRAIERGGRAPSEASGLRILTELFTSDQWSKNHFGPSLHAMRDSEAKAPVVVEFGAKSRGDNGRWSRDRLPGESASGTEDEILRKVEKNLLENPEKLQKLQQTFAGLAGAIKLHVAHLKEPIDDENLGKVVRRLPAITNLQADHLDKLLWLWSRINTGTASLEVIDEVQKIDKILGSFFSEDELKEFSKDEDHSHLTRTLY